jgi:hypothetical protein
MGGQMRVTVAAEAKTDGASAWCCGPVRQVQQCAAGGALALGSVLQLYSFGEGVAAVRQACRVAAGMSRALTQRCSSSQ